MGTVLPTLLVGIVIHFLGDYVLQRLLSRLGLRKTRHLTHMLIHCLTADGLALAVSAYLIGNSWQYAISGLIVGTVAHAAVDLWGLRGSIPIKFADQALHIVALSAYAIYIR